MELASLILSIIALGVSLMALPTVFQMIWGAPKLSFGNSTYEHEQGKLLRIEIQNDPIKNKALRKLGVVRTPAEISGDYEIRERGTKKTVFNLQQSHFISPAGSNGLQVSIGNAVMPVFFNVLYINNDGIASFYKKDSDSFPIVDPGEYEIRFSIFEHTQSLHQYSQFLRVGEGKLNTFFMGEPIRSSEVL